MRSKTVGVAGTVGLLLLAMYAAKRFNVGSKILEGLGGFGAATGQAITAPFQGLLEGVTEGASSLQKQGEETFKPIFDLGDSIQRGINQAQGKGPISFLEDEALDKNKPEKMQELISMIDFVQPTNIITSFADVGGIARGFTPSNVQRRLSTQISQARNQAFPFGGFKNAANQEINLRSEIAKSQARYPDAWKKAIEKSRETNRTRGR